MKFVSDDNRNMANGNRDTSKKPLTASEIELVKSEIKRINAYESNFIFNDVNHMNGSTCYAIDEDKIYVTRNVFPDNRYGSTHPRDLMSVAAVLAHEYYGHRSYRDEYLADLAKEEYLPETPEWEDECRASITAAKITPNLTQKERSDLIMDAIYRAKEYGHLIEMDDFMKEVIYGYGINEKNITRELSAINYVSEESHDGMEPERSDNNKVSKMRKFNRDYYDFGE